MTRAVLFVHGLGNQINQGEWIFQQLNRPGSAGGYLA